MDSFEDFDLETWLEARSDKNELSDGELRFYHKDNTTSVLIPRNDNDGLDPKLLSSPLSWFYKKYLCGSIGNSHIIIGSSKVDGVEISHRYKVPGRLEMTDVLKRVDVTSEVGDYFFAVESAWMFAYAVRPVDNGFELIRFDRDMQTSEVVFSIKSIFDDWWNLVSEDF
ncbi:MAG: hypothetical protein ACPGN3_02225 [Opitutales bacterium]